MEKVVRDGKVAVLYSPGFGAGWYSWNSDYKGLLFDPEIVALVEEDKRDQVETIVKNKYSEHIYCGGVSDLTIEWLPQGTIFEIDDYDGNESIRWIGNSGDWITA